MLTAKNPAAVRLSSKFLCEAALAAMFFSSAAEAPASPVFQSVDARESPGTATDQAPARPRKGAEKALDPAELEKALAADPDNDAARLRLLEHYSGEGDIPKARVHAMYLIEKRPEASEAMLATLAWDAVARSGRDSETLDRLARIWEKHAAEHPDSPRVIGNAAYIMIRAGQLFDAEALMKRFKRLDVEGLPEGLGLDALYAGAILGKWPGSEEFAPKARAELDTTSDAALLAGVAEVILLEVEPPGQRPGAAEPAGRDPGQRLKLAESYLRRALSLHPDGEHVKSAKALLEKRTSRSPETPKVGGNRIAVPGHVQASKLLFKPEPVYPAEALAAGAQGAVRFTAILARDGSVKSLFLVSGHPLLVEAAAETARNYRYQMTVISGEPVEVVTTIDVLFILPAGGGPRSGAFAPVSPPADSPARAPSSIHKPTPEYSPEARAAGREGTPVLRTWWRSRER